MKIKTVWTLLDQVYEFDAKINACLAEGWVLRKREMVQGIPYTDTAYARRVLYAELELPDKEETIALPEPPNPFEAARRLQEYCLARSGCQGCKFHFDGCILANRTKPCYWWLPEGKA